MVYRKPFRDDVRVGAYLNKRLINSPTNYLQAQGYYYGDPIKFAFAYFDHMPMGKHGWCAEIALAGEPDFRFSRKVFRDVLAIFFENRYHNNNIRLQALISPDNQQALRLARLAGFQDEGRLRSVAKDGDRILLSILKEDFERLYGRNIQQTKGTTSAT